MNNTHNLFTDAGSDELLRLLKYRVMDTRLEVMRVLYEANKSSICSIDISPLHLSRNIVEYELVWASLMSCFGAIYALAREINGSDFADTVGAGFITLSLECYGGHDSFEIPKTKYRGDSKNISVNRCELYMGAFSDNSETAFEDMALHILALSYKEKQLRSQLANEYVINDIARYDSFYITLQSLILETLQKSATAFISHYHETAIALHKYAATYQ